jgi:ABC-type transport system involved in multi-copper enzyme maturation permease subunit
MGAISQFLGNLRIWPGPILAVELVTTARRTRYFVIRVLYAAALFFALGLTYENAVRWGRYSDMNAIAQFTSAFFATFGVMQLMVVLLIGPAMAAGTIAQERERRTMEYLYASPLSNLEIIIGKLGGRVLQILYLVLSGVPVLALAMLLGGIAPRNIVTLTGITLSTVLFVAMVSMAVSAWTAKARDAVVRAYLLFFCIWVLPFPLLALTEIGPTYTWMRPLVDQFLVTNPVVAFTMILDGRGLSGTPIEPWPLLLNLVSNQMLLGGTAIVLATLFMRRVHLRESGKPDRKRRWRFQLFRGQIGDNPMHWKEMYAEPGSSRLGLLGYGLLAVIFATVCGITIYSYIMSIDGYGRYYWQGEYYCNYAIYMSTFLSCCGLLLMTARAAGSITVEKERDSWVSLIGTPLEGAQIVKAKIMGSLWSLRGLAPFLAVVLLPALTLRPSFFLGMLFSLLNLGILAAFLAALGVYCSLRSKSTLRAMAAALGITLVIGGGYMLCCCPVMELGARGGGDEGFILGAAPCMPFLLFWPELAGMMIDRNYRGGPPERDFGLFMAACLIGTIGYAVAGGMIMVATVDQFDEQSGRVRGRARYSPRPPVPS